WDGARAAWRISVALSNEHGLENELTYYLEQFPQLAGQDDAPPDLVATAADAPAAIPTRESATPEVPTPTSGLDHAQGVALEIARTNGRVTARELMDECAVSKATATRKLTGLADMGLLIKAGKGRGVHYLPPQAAAEAAEQSGTDRSGEPIRSPRAVSKALERQRVLLQQYFKVDSLAMPSIAPDFTCPLEMVVRFTVTPDLATFFTLEARLSALLNTRVNLTPDLDHVDAVGHARFRDPRWIWRADQK
ncbi:MAG: HTH domain-containing protein, partial [Caldilineaceae bacterium]|nr:HTH domain-containing protein [Caldilineaceae bacterium]